MSRLRRARQSTVCLLSVVVLTTTAGCGIRVVSGEDAAATTTTTTVADGASPSPTTQPADDPDAPATTEEAGGSNGDEPTATTDGSPGAGGSLAEPISCDEFEALTPGGRMLSVYNGSAPETGCEGLYAPAKVASDVFAVTAELAKTHGAVINDSLPSPLVADADCTDGALTLVVENAFDAPLVLWGALIFRDEDDETVAFKPFITDVLQPDERATITADASQYNPDSCAYELRPLVAPTGELAPDVGGPATEGPQSSEQIEEWFPALMQSERDAIAGDDPAAYVDFVEDIHSPDLWVQLFLDNAIEAVPVEPSEPESTVPVDGGQKVVFESTENSFQTLYCSTIEQPTIEGVEGEFAFVLYEWAKPSDGNANSFGIGLYRRGTDNRWRYIGRTALVWDGFLNSPRDRCDPPPMID